MYDNEQRLQKELNRIWGDWTITGLLGEGSYGKVYRIAREDFGHTYEAALKVITIPKTQSEIVSVMSDGMDEQSATAYFKSIVEDIVEEFALMAKLKGNTNIVSYEDHAVVPFEEGIGWNIYIRMELLQPLYSYIKEHTMSIRDVINLGIDMCQALEICQRYNIIHRDIKPENIFVSDLGRYKLGDFGIAKQLENTNAGLSRKGTYTYMAPDVYKGEEYNSTVDIYSLGIVLYRFLNNNRTPFLPPYPQAIRHTDTEHAVVLRMSGAEIPKPCNAEGRLAEIVLKACAYNAKDRYESGADMKRALQSVLYDSSEAGIIYPNGDQLQTMNATTEKSTGSNLSKSDYLPYEKEVTEETVVLEEDTTDLESAVWNEEPENEETIVLEEPVSVPVIKTKDKKSTGKNGKVIGIAVAVIAAIAVGVGFMITRPSKVEVPDLTQISIEEAQKKAENLKIKEGSTDYSDTIAKGLIISQDAKAGTSAKAGSVINVVVSAGKLVTVENFVGKEYEATVNNTEYVILTVSEERYSDNVPAGAIIEQSESEGTKVSEGTEIKVVVSKGIEQVRVPDVTGKKEDAAKKLIEEAQLTYDVETKYSSSVDKDKVIRQSKNAGDQVVKGTKIIIEVSKGKKKEPATQPPQNTYVPPAKPAAPSGNTSNNNKNNKKPADKADSIEDWDLVN